MAASSAEPRGATEFAVTHIFKARRQRVWDAWTKPEMLVRWFGPKGMTMAVLQSDLRPGGLLHTHMDSADGQRLWARFVYREVTEPSRLVWVHSFSDPQAGLARAPFGIPWPLEMLATATFEDAGDITKVTLRLCPIHATPEEENTFAEGMPSMRGGWGGSFGQLDQVLAGPG
jgi:uncharacterized protein YndB with AHSA1/START domain